ncbi:uncharacterized protein LOC134215972 [Armigeres subalbatus]|uniref:uncharacterized protein LOC134215972 n=1 Tax=Armigeres subalbatus TaxID=124917 RepID=UPI002ED3E077
MRINRIIRLRLIFDAVHNEGMQRYAAVLQPDSSKNVTGKSDLVEVIRMPQYCRIPAACSEYYKYEDSTGLFRLNMDGVVLGYIEDVQLVFQVHSLQNVSFANPNFPGDSVVAAIDKDGWHHQFG